jgi:hypothetical protein
LFFKEREAISTQSMNYDAMCWLSRLQHPQREEATLLQRAKQQVQQHFHFHYHFSCSEAGVNI